MAHSSVETLRCSGNQSINLYLKQTRRSLETHVINYTKKKKEESKITMVRISQKTKQRSVNDNVTTSFSHNEL